MNSIKLEIVSLAFLMLLLVGGCAGAGRSTVADSASDVPAAEEAPPTSLERAAMREGRGPAEESERPDEQPHVVEIGGQAAETAKPVPETAAQAPEKPLRPSPRNIYKPAGSETRADESGGEVVFNFDDADIYEVIKTVGEILNISYVVDPQVTGKVTIHTARGLSKGDLFPIFNQILDLNGLAAVKEGELYRIVQLKDAPRLPVLSRFGRDEIAGAAAEQVIIQLIPLGYISPDEMTKLLTPFVSANGVILSHPGSNTLVVVDKSSNIGKVLKLVDVFDANVFDNVHYRVYNLKHMQSDEMSKILEDIFSAYGARENLPMKFVSISSLNIMMVVSSTRDIFPRIQTFINELDVASEQSVHKIYVYYVRNGEANNLSEILNNVFGGADSSKVSKSTSSKKTPASSYSRNPFSESAIRERVESEKRETSPPASESKASSTAADKADSDSGTLKDEVNITADEIRNALIIEALPSDYRVIEEILDKLDILPRQVLIEATIAEITLDKSDELGVEWSFGSAVPAELTSFASTLGASGFSYTIGVAEKWHAALKALASRSKVNILSSPHVLASDNKEARMDVSREIPVASSSYRYSSSTDPVTETNIQYRDTGVILTVTPHINERGLVTMEISQEVSDLSDAVQVGGQEYPSFFKRTVNTTLTVRDGQTLVIGGLIKDKEDQSYKGAPCLVNAPVLRYLTGTGSQSVEKTELVILITPRVITDDSDIDVVTREFQEKVIHAAEYIQRN